VLAYRPGFIVNRRAIERFGKEYVSNVVGTGPYVYEQWTPGQGILVTANKDYYGPAPKIQRVMFRIIKEDPTAEIALEKGDIQLSFFDTAEVMQRLAASRRVTSQTIAGPRTYWVHINMERPPFTDLRVRQALNYATNKDAIVEHVFLRQGVAKDVTRMISTAPANSSRRPASLGASRTGNSSL
jgi:ABC-type transport system substrate-binding protein